jgi:hypothetical protein
VVGRVVAVQEGTGDFDQVLLKLQRVSDAPPFPNLLKDRLGETLSVAVSRKLVARTGLAPGSILKVRVRLSNPTQAHSHPEYLEKIA